MAETEEQPTLAAMWHSVDGRAWELLPALADSPAGLWPYHLTWVTDGLVMQGSALQDGERVVVLGRWNRP